MHTNIQVKVNSLIKLAMQNNICLDLLNIGDGYYVDLSRKKNFEFEDEEYLDYYDRYLSCDKYRYYFNLRDCFNDTDKLSINSNYIIVIEDSYYEQNILDNTILNKLNILEYAINLLIKLKNNIDVKFKMNNLNCYNINCKDDYFFNMLSLNNDFTIEYQSNKKTTLEIIGTLNIKDLEILSNL